MTRAGVLTDEMWARIEPLLPPVKGVMGRPMRDHRLLVEAAIYRYRCGIAWRDLPAEFGPWQTAWKRHARFSRDGTWDRVLTRVLAEADAVGELAWTVAADSTIARAHQHATNTTRAVAESAGGHTGAGSSYNNPLAEPADHGIGRSRGGLTSKLHTLVDGRGRPLVLLVTAGQVNDSPVLPVLLDQLRVPRIGPDRPRVRPDVLIADKAHSARAHRARLRAAKVTTVIPEPSDQIRNRARRGSRGGRPPSFDAAIYKARNVVERGYNTVKQWRGLATRYDKLAVVYRGAAVLLAIITWLKDLGDTP